MTPDSGTPISWREFDRLQKRVDKLEDTKASDRDMHELAEEVSQLRRALIVFSLSMIGTSGMFLLGVLTIIGPG